MSAENSVVAIAGLSKAGKSALAVTLSEATGGKPYELIEPVMDEISREESNPTTWELLEFLRRIRESKGVDVLARLVSEKIMSADGGIQVVSGLRCYDDHVFLQKSFVRYRIIYVHSPDSIRYDRMLHDEFSIARTTQEFLLLDSVSYDQGISRIAKESYWTIINDTSYPVTFESQVRQLVVELRKWTSEK